MKIRVIGEDGKKHDAIRCIECAEVVILDGVENVCVKCDIIYDRCGNIQYRLTQQEKEDKEYIESGRDYYLGKTDEEINKLMGW